MNTGIKYYWMSLNITVLATNLRLVMKPASFLSFLVFVACSMKFVQNFILQATNAQCLGTRLNETHIEASYTVKINGRKCAYIHGANYYSGSV